MHIRNTGTVPFWSLIPHRKRMKLCPSDHWGSRNFSRQKRKRLVYSDFLTKITPHWGSCQPFTDVSIVISPEGTRCVSQTEKRGKRARHVLKSIFFSLVFSNFHPLLAQFPLDSISSLQIQFRYKFNFKKSNSLYTESKFELTDTRVNAAQSATKVSCKLPRVTNSLVCTETSSASGPR